MIDLKRTFFTKIICFLLSVLTRSERYDILLGEYKERRYGYAENRTLCGDES